MGQQKGRVSSVARWGHRVYKALLVFSLTPQLPFIPQSWQWGDCTSNGRAWLDQHLLWGRRSWAHGPSQVMQMFSWVLESLCAPGESVFKAAELQCRSLAHTCIQLWSCSFWNSVSRCLVFKKLEYLTVCQAWGWAQNPCFIIGMCLDTVSSLTKKL